MEFIRENESVSYAGSPPTSLEGLPVEGLPIALFHTYSKPFQMSTEKKAKASIRKDREKSTITSRSMKNQ